MAVVSPTNLDADHVVDNVKDKIRVESITVGTGAPGAAPAVPEKGWIYINRTDDVASYWDPVDLVWTAINVT